ncbi:isochorismatase family protein [Uliginosibacterium sp. H3]|uniref:isochorismatase n=1 Tax=Uliginosibacterium silvisoli TaxID=3114758 RepID=A0ABU6K1X5_9RHOO|nr:isochorismatase family protein [Uliginosibacterium sp. H3]
MTIPRIASYDMPAASSFPANRVEWNADPARAALLIHDMQQYFLDFYDNSAAPIPQLVEHIRQLRDAADAKGIPVYYTAQPAVQPAEDRALLNEFWGPGLPAKPEGAPVIAALAPRATDIVLDKWRYSAFVRSDLLERLRAQQRDQLIVCGVYAHIGCQVTCVDAFMRDIQPVLVGDALADFGAERHAQALDYVSQRAGVVRSTAQVLASLGVSASTLPADIDALHAEVAAILEMPKSDLNTDDNLLYAGLDSIRLMSLLERWKRAGSSINFVQLAEQPTIAQWWALLNEAR